MWKRYLACLLLAAMLLVGAGCGGQITTESSTTQSTATADSEQEAYIRAMMWDYFEIVRKLDQYTPGDTAFHVSTGDRSKSYSGNEAFQYCYARLQELAELDPWLNIDSWRKYMGSADLPNFDRLAYLEKFAVLEDVCLQMNYTTYYADPQIPTLIKERYALWEYNPDGTVVYIGNGVAHWDPLQRYRDYTFADLIWAYDENDRVSYGYFGTLTEMRTMLVPEYDHAGRVIREEIWRPDSGNTECVISYTYDEDGRLHRMEVDAALLYITEYFYDEGKLIREVKDECNDEGRVLRRVEVEYTYDSEDCLSWTLSTISGAGYNGVELVVWGMNLDYYVFDDQGSMLTVKKYTQVTCCEDGSVEPTPGYDWHEENYIYGDKYIYGEYTLIPPK